MTLLGLVLRSARFFWRSHLGVFLGAILATAIITGALAVGDSVRYSLARMAQARLGHIELALHSPGRFFRAKLGADLSRELRTDVAPVILLRGTATGQKADGSGGDVRVGRVQVLGVTGEFWRLAIGGKEAQPMLLAADGTEGVALNERLARSLRLAVGDEVILRVDKPSLMSRDAPLSTIEDATVTIRLPVTALVPDTMLGRFSLDANQVPPYNAFLPLPALQKLVGMEARANTLLVSGRGNATLEPAAATSVLWKHWEFADSGLALRNVPGQKLLELRTDRVFLDPPIADAARRAMPSAKGVLTYFVNELRVGDRATPYSTVAALQGPLIPPGMGDNEAIVNQWFAEDVGAKVGDTVSLKYYLVGPMRRLEQHTSAFRIRAVVPMTGVARDPALMPDIPGLSDKKDCRDWEPGVPVDLDRIRDKDQAYWDAYKGTPKVFLTLAAGQRIWNNRFGDLTAVRYPSPTLESRGLVETCVRQALNPASQGLFFVPVRERAARASAESLDFGQLFLGFSFFLIVAALLLAALLFAFAMEQRAEEVGTLLALGFRPRRVQQLLLLEGGVIALVAGVLGVGLATLYTRGIIAGLSGVWSGAVADAALAYHATPQTLLTGGIAGFVMALLSIFLVTRRQAKAPARELLAGGGEDASRVWGQARGKGMPGIPTIIVGTILAVVFVALAVRGGGEGGAAAGYFFGAGAMLLIASIAACRAFLARVERRETGASLTLGSLATRNAVRRTARSLGAITLLACGSFLVIAVGANRHDPGADAERRSSGTGGFALYGESSLPVYSDLNMAEGREEFGLDAAALGDARIVALRLREGDDASCLNLNRAQTPRLLGVATEELQRRNAFAFAETLGGKADDPWRLLDQTSPDGTVPVVGDTNTVVWSLGKKLGDTVPYTDDRGNTYRLKIVGVLANSIVQGGLILSESNFIRLFPSQSGYQVFLVDAAPSTAAVVSRELTLGLENVGLSLLPAAERLAAFNTVEDTYLSIFAILGGLGLLLGSAGLGVIVLRNVWDRRAELALLRAVGFRQGTLFRLLFREHALLLTLGLAAGITSALVAVLPAMRSPGAEIPYLTLGLTLLAVFISGFVFTALATAIALRSRLLDALRNE